MTQVVEKKKRGRPAKNSPTKTQVETGQKLCAGHVADSVEEYLSKKQYLSSSDIKTIILETPRHYLYNLNKENNEEKDHLTLGSAVHCKVLEPHLFEKKFFHLKKSMLPQPDKDFRIKENRIARDNFIAEAKTKGAQVVTDKMLEQIEYMAASVMSNEAAVKLLKGTITEQSFYVDRFEVDEEFSIKARVRPDALSLKDKYYISVKTTRDASRQGFGKQCEDFGYHISEAFYLKVLRKCLPENIRPNRGYFIAIESNPPYLCSVFDTNPDAEHDQISEFLQIGAHYMNLAFMRVKDIVRTGEYKGYNIESENDNGIMPIQLPDYSKYKANTKII